jgi:hypothetical protein
MNALSLSRHYYLETADPILRRDFPELYPRLAAGLFGNGSECFGCDDAVSRDHDWGVDFFIWTDEKDKGAHAALSQWKQELLRALPPPYRRAQSEHGAVVDVMTYGDCFRRLIGYEAGPKTLSEWMRVPENNLAMATNGDVFYDGPGTVTEIRERLKGHYPLDLLKAKLAARCAAMAQTGQYNLERTYRRGDWVTYRNILSRFTEQAVYAVFLLNRVFMPYYKWAYKKMAALPLLGQSMAPLLEIIALSPIGAEPDHRRIVETVESLCAMISKELHRQNFVHTNETFLTVHAGILLQSIEDVILRTLPMHALVTGVI